VVWRRIVEEDSLEDRVRNNIVLRDYHKVCSLFDPRVVNQLVHGGKLYYFPMLNGTVYKLLAFMVIENPKR
jgi:hypothetical protein